MWLKLAIFNTKITVFNCVNYCRKTELSFIALNLAAQRMVVYILVNVRLTGKKL